MNNQKINAKKKYFVISFIKEIVDEKWIYDIQLEKGTVATSFVPYGQGSTEIKIENSDKTQDLTYVLPIQQEMLKGDYFLKELDIWKEVHNWQKIDSYNGESITTDYISTTGSLTTGATVFYKLQTPKKIPCTEEQSKILNQLNALDLFEGVNDITTTENIALLQLKYVSNVDEIDILEQEIEKLNTTKVDKVPGKGLSTEDYTTEEKQKLAGLTNYDDTEIKEDIAKIQEEQTTQNQKIEKIEDNQIHIKTEQSSTINVQDCSNLSAKIDVFGVSNQETRSGKNFFDVSKDLTSANTDYEYTHLDNGYRIKLTQATSGARYMVYSGQIHLEPGQYIFSCLLTVSGGTKNNRGRVRIYNSSGSIIYPVASDIDCNNKLKYGSFNIEEATDITIAFYYVSNSTIEITENANIYCEWKNIQIEKSSDTQPTEYEDYGKSPSPEYPSEIENVIRDINITIEKEDKSQTQTIIFPLQEGQKMYEGSYTANDGIHHVRTQDNNVSGTSKTFSNAKENGKYMCNVKESGTLNGKTITFETSVTNATVEYELAEEETEAYTEAQQEVYNQLQNVTPYKLVTNISTDKAKLQFNYIADTKTYIDNKVTNMQKQLNTINELLSTANTSAMLLDNLQTDLESEVL